MSPEVCRRVVVALFVLVGAGSLLTACGSDGPPRQAGDCGFFSQDKTGRRSSMAFQRRACTDPEAVLRLIAVKSKSACADPAYGREYGRRGIGRTRYHDCAQINARVGECVNDAEAQYAHLYKLRKVACGTAGAYRVDTRIDRNDPQVCGLRVPTAKAVAVTFRNPPLSYCFVR
ncbi:hypothetical protein ACFYTF_15600 [Nocardia thailandica]|uniref:Lipoprotein n=1 Tax=Nocardia thailandica TaxID=257275 RepID=A0ABW6PPC2_9NOCA